MIKYIQTKEKIHMENILTHLRAYNVKFTGQKEVSSHYFYVLEEHKLVGALKTTFSWDWASISELYYEDLDVLKLLLSKVCEVYKHKATGIKAYSDVMKRYQDFLAVGFLPAGKISGTVKTRNFYYVENLFFDIISDSKKTIISQPEIDEKYDEKLKTEIQQFEKENTVLKKNDDIVIVGLVDGIFAGGVHGEIKKDSMYVNLLVVNEAYRGKRVGTNLMLKLEEEAKKKGVVQIDVGTAEFQAKPFYEKLGYKVVMATQDFPKGFECYTLIKRLRK